MSWTDERVERLSKLWLEGRTASQIAAELGQGVTRNAVIGKVHRIGLSGRGAVSAGEGARGLIRGDDAVTTPAAETPVVTAVPMPTPSIAPVARATVELTIPASDRVTIMDLREAMCRWPLGDPTSSEFRFCGCRVTSGTPYCAAHARVAFQPLADRRRVDRMARIA